MRVSVLLAVFAIGVFALNCKATESQASTSDLLKLSLKELLNVKVETATGQQQSAREAPAIISVISKADIELWNYRSVGEALSQVAGLYSIGDYVSPNYGVRGINGGQRSYNRVLKVMIDGQNVAFRSEQTNFLGVELIPMSVVERIEVIRGPGSALYGENAFLGVINIITRPPGENDQQSGSMQMTARARQQGGFDWSANYDLFNSLGKWRAALAVNQQIDDDIPLAQSSPRFNEFPGQKSQDTFNRSANLYFSWQRTIENISHQIDLQHSQLKVKADFLDFGTLSHNNLVATSSDRVSYQGTNQFNNTKKLKWRLQWMQSSPDSSEKLDLGQLNTRRERDYESQAIDAGLAYTWQNSLGNFTTGVDFVKDREQTIAIYDVNEIDDSRVLLSNPSTELTLQNQGLYLQWLFNNASNWNTTVNLRYDNHNIFGDNFNYRLGGFYQLSDNLSAKVLLGSSYKAPATFQLYAQPLYPGEFIGNENLLPEKATTSELNLNWEINQQFATNLTIWHTRISDKVSFLPKGANLQPTNVSRQKGKGAELETSWLLNSSQLFGSISWQSMTETKAEPLTPVSELPTTLFPKLMLSLRYQKQFSQNLNLGLKFNHVSPRRASESNINLNLQKPYQLTSYNELNALLSYQHQQWKVSFEIKNLLDQEFDYPGFGGIDIATRGRQFSLTTEYKLEH